MQNKNVPPLDQGKRAYRLRRVRCVAAAETFRHFIECQKDVKDKLRLIDVGVGRGRLMQFLDPQGDLDDTIMWTGVDNDPVRLGQISESGRWQLHSVDIQDGLPFPDNTFDMVFCEQVLEHISNPEGVLGEMVRVLRPGGKAVIGVPSFVAGISFLRKRCVWAVERFGHRTPSHVGTFTKSSFVRLCTDAGLVVEEVRGFRFVSGGLIGFLENYYWWYRVNRWLGRKFPGLCVEVQVVATKAAGRAK